MRPRTQVVSAGGSCAAALPTASEFGWSGWVVGLCVLARQLEAGGKTKNLGGGQAAGMPFAVDLANTF